jgi:hypothetical protein
MFTKHAGTGLLVLASGVSLTLEGCNLAQNIENWAPVGQSAFDGIISLLQGVGLVSPAISLLIPVIDTAFTDLIADAKAYGSVNPPPAGTLAKLEEVFNLIVGNLQSLFAQLQVTNPIINVVLSLGKIIFETIAGFIKQLPAAVQSRMQAKLNGQFKVGVLTVPFTPVHRTVRQFKKAFNSAAKAAGHPEIELKLGLFEHF